MTVKEIANKCNKLGYNKFSISALIKKHGYNYIVPVEDLVSYGLLIQSTYIDCEVICFELMKYDIIYLRVFAIANDIQGFIDEYI